MHDEHSKVKKDKTPEPELMEDDEGKVADVASSVTLAEVRRVQSGYCMRWVVDSWINEV
jgi:hypothetical protein